MTYVKLVKSTKEKKKWAVRERYKVAKLKVIMAKTSCMLN